MERIMHVRESATIPKARGTIRTQPAGIVLNTETKILTSKLTGKASAAVTMKVTSVMEVAIADDPTDAPQIF
jgi:hypothetical protein